jgi:hypothetical protein
MTLRPAKRTSRVKPVGESEVIYENLGLRLQSL